MNSGPLITRRNALIGTLAASVATQVKATPGTAPRILLRSGWQIENIGDVAHTPGMLRLLEEHIPNAEVTFWPWYDYLPPHEERMIRARFPKMRLAQGKLADGKASTPELARAIESADFMLHNSGPYALAWKDLEAFSAMTGKPFGVFGVTYGHWVFGNEERDTLSKASFVYFRDRVSLRKARFDGVAAPITDWAPDAAFATDVVDETAGRKIMQQFGLQPGNFMVCLPKQRFTPTWLHVRKNRPIDNRMEERNNEMAEIDHVPLREAIVRLVREAGQQVLIGSEDETEVSIGKTWLWDRLPADVKPRVHWLGRQWHMEEALGVYRQSAGLFGHEMHSPVMCIGLGIPALVGRWVEQSSKGTMWNDIGLNEWLFNMDCDADAARLPETVLQVALNPAAAKEKTAAARAIVFNRFAQGIKVVEQASAPQRPKRRT